MNPFRLRYANFALLIIFIAMLAAPVAAELGGSLFVQAAVLSAGLLIAGLCFRPTLRVFLTALCYAVVVFALALLESQRGAEVLPVWLLAGLVTVYWFQLQCAGTTKCCTWFRQSPTSARKDGML